MPQQMTTARLSSSAAATLEHGFFTPASARKPSAKLSRATMEADAVNVGYCSYVVSMRPRRGRTVHVGYRPPEPHGSDASKSALAQVERLLDAIAREAVK
jgi:hypothetical protein